MVNSLALGFSSQSLFFMELWCLPNKQPLAQVEFEPEGFIGLWITGHQMLGNGNHRYQLVTHSHVHRNSNSLAFELMLYSVQRPPMEIERCSVLGAEWERFRRTGSRKTEERGRLSSPVRATGRKESGRYLECQEAVRFLEFRIMLGRGKGKAGQG